LFLQNYNGHTHEELKKEKELKDLYKQTPLLNSVVKDVNGVDMKVTVELVETQAEFKRKNGKIVLFSKPGSWVYPCFKSLIFYFENVTDVPDHSHWFMKFWFPKEVQETKLVNICNVSYHYYRICQAILNFNEILSNLKTYKLKSTDVVMFQNLMLSKWIDTKKELIKLEVEGKSYKLLRFEYIRLHLIDQKT
jgi:hypothetical protein